MRALAIVAFLALSSSALAITLTSPDFDVRRVIPGNQMQGITFTPNGDLYMSYSSTVCKWAGAANLPIGQTLGAGVCANSNVGHTNICSSKTGRIYNVNGWEIDLTSPTFQAHQRWVDCGASHGIAVDSRDGAIFVSSVNSGRVWRIADPDTAPQGLIQLDCTGSSLFFDGVAAGVGGFDGITIGPDGTFYGAGYTQNRFIVLSPYTPQTPTGTVISARKTIAQTPDGISICIDDGDSFALIAMTSSSISRFKLSGPQNTLFNEDSIANNIGGYLDFSAVDPKGCIWGTTLFGGALGTYRVTNADGSCGCASPQVPQACDSNPCQAGDCTNLPDGYTCECPTGICGTNCEAPCGPTDPCDPNPCVHGQCGLLAGGGYHCSCEVGWQGANCDYPANDCASSPCGQFGTCQQLAVGYQCVCLTDHCGHNCDEIDLCVTAPCGANGNCANDHANGVFVCDCTNGYTGTLCDVAPQQDPCNPSPCAHGVCSLGSNGYLCACAPGWTGPKCDQATDPCTPSPCAHGQCVLQAVGFVCVCESGWQGTFCDQSTTPASCNPSCQHGNCVLMAHGCQCTCDNGWQGANCDEPAVTPCSPNPCAHGACVLQAHGAVCVCQDGWQGPLCDQPVAPPNDCCNPNPCKNDGVCSVMAVGFVCTCCNGWTGPTCEGR